MVSIPHGITVPPVYRSVAKILQKVKEDRMGLKSAVYENSTTFNRNKARHFKLATKILENYSKIEHVIDTTKILSKEPDLRPWMAYVIIHELLFRKDLDHPCKPIQTVISYKKELFDALATYQESDSVQPKVKVVKPRYVRVNTFKISVNDVINRLRNDGMVLLPIVYQTYSEFLEAVKNLQYNHFMIDFHINELLLFFPSPDIFKHQFYKDGTFILQDKSSCLAPLLLEPPLGSVVLDMCAAPGMKTNYLANIVGTNGRVYAVERNKERHFVLCNLMNKHGKQNISCMHRDAMGITGDELADVEYILVDPSCSGSGITDRIDVIKSKPDRLKFLAGFQNKILRHALTKFPNVKRVVYSTCSINPEENEEVVSFCLGATDNFKLVNLQEKLESNWNNFGSDKYGEIGTSCLYATSEDLTNGFFVAVFERVTKKSKKKRKYEETEETASIDETKEEENNIKDKKKKRKNKSNADDKLQENIEDMKIKVKCASVDETNGEENNSKDKKKK